MWREAIAVWRVARDPDLGDVGVLAARGHGEMSLACWFGDRESMEPLG